MCLLAGVQSGCVHRPSPEALAEAAINGSPALEQERAVLELTRHGQASVSALRRVVAESRSPQVRAIAFQALGAFGDIESGPAMIEAMDDPDPRVRGRAAVAMVNILGVDFQFRAEDPPAKRRAIVDHVRRTYEQLRTKLESKN
jgi:hypothetical protein